MTHKLTRREVLTQSLGTAAVAGGLASGNLASVSEAAEPIDRNGSSHMKLSLAGYSFNRLMPRNWSVDEPPETEMNLEMFVDFCAAQNVDGAELTAYYFPNDVSVEYLLKLKQMTFRLGLDISGTAIGNDFCLAPGPARDAQLAMTRSWIDNAAILGAPVIRIFAGKVPKGETEEVALERCIDGINESLEYAASKGVFLALENHGGITSTADQLLSIVKAVSPSPWFGVNFDSGNFRTEDPYGDLARIAPYAVNAQIKVAIAPNGTKEDADFARIIRILRESEYRGYIVLEYEEREPFARIPQHLKLLRELING